jgi:hypothetical protein
MGTRHRIDHAFIRAISPNGKYQALQDADLTGFGIKVSPVGTVAYTYRWVKPDGSQGRRNIARWPDLQPGEARGLCRREIALLDRKSDSPLQLVERKAQRVAVQKVAGVPTIRVFLDGRYELHLLTKLTQARATLTAKMIRMSFPQLLDTALDECTALTIEAWRSDLLKAGLKPSTLNRKLNALRGLFARAVEWELIPAGPMKKVRKQAEPDGKVRLREYMGWERTEFTYRFAPATLDNNDRKRCYDNLRSLEVRKQRMSELLVWLEPMLKISAAILQNDDLTRLTPDALVALRERYAGPSMDALTVVVNRCCDGVEPTPEEYRAAMDEAEKNRQA